MGLRWAPKEPPVLNLRGLTTDCKPEEPRRRRSCGLGPSGPIWVWGGDCEDGGHSEGGTVWLADECRVGIPRGRRLSAQA